MKRMSKKFNRVCLRYGAMIFFPSVAAFLVLLKLGPEGFPMLTRDEFETLMWVPQIAMIVGFVLFWGFGVMPRRLRHLHNTKFSEAQRRQHTNNFLILED